MAARSGISFTLAAIIVVVILAVSTFAVVEYETITSGTSKTTSESTTSSTMSSSSSTNVIVTFTITSTPSSSPTKITTTTSTIMPPTVFNFEVWNVSGNTYGYPPSLITFNSNSSEIYLSGAPSNNITIIDANTHNVTGILTMPGIDAEHIDVDPETNILLVWVVTCNEPNKNASTCPANDISTTVAEITASTGAVIHAFPLYPGYFAVNFASSTIYEIQPCPNPNGPILNPYYTNCGFLTSYDMLTGSLTSNTSLNAEPYGIAVNPNNNMVYVLASQNLLVINGTNGLTEGETSLSFYSSSTPILQVDANTDTVFALGINATSTIITAINGTTGAVIYSSVIGSACNIDSNRYYVNPYTNQIYASGFNSILGSNYFLIIDATTGRLVNMLSTQAYEYADSTFNPKLNDIYLLMSKGNASQLVSLPSEITSTYVNPSLLRDSQCYAVPT